MLGGLRVAVGIATTKRAAILAENLRELSKQTLAPSRVLICHVHGTDIAGADTVEPLMNGVTAEFILSPPGLPIQRNAIIDRIDDCDVVIFFDDDFFACPRYIEITERMFRTQPDLVVTTGNVIADGIKTAGIPPDDARRMIAADVAAGDACDIERTYNGYGCNMAIRLSTVREHALRFDERLALYAWYEDIDFTRRVGKYGKIAKLSAARGVHLGTKTGRSPGRQLGYSQVVNPVYLARKGTYDWHRAAISVVKNVAANSIRSFWPEPWVDRGGRLRGNVVGLVHLIGGRCEPEFILHLASRT